MENVGKSEYRNLEKPIYYKVYLIYECGKMEQNTKAVSNYSHNHLEQKNKIIKMKIEQKIDFHKLEMSTGKNQTCSAKIITLNLV